MWWAVTLFCVFVFVFLRLRICICVFVLVYLHLWESKDNGVITSHLCSASPFFLRIQPSTSLSSKGEGALAIQKVLKCQTKNHQFWKTKSSFSYPHEAKVHKKERKTVLHLSPKLNLRNSILQQKDLLFGTHPFTQPCFSLLFFFNSTFSIIRWGTRPQSSSSTSLCPTCSLAASTCLSLLPFSSHAGFHHPHKSHHHQEYHHRHPDGCGALHCVNCSHCSNMRFMASQVRRHFHLYCLHHHCQRHHHRHNIILTFDLIQISNYYFHNQQHVPIASQQPSVFNILAITINRYVMIAHPTLYPR